MKVTDYLIAHLWTVMAGCLGGISLMGFLACGGCGGPTGETLSGQVKSQGKPVTFGTVTVIASDNKAYSTAIKSDGTYEIRGLPRGPVKIAVTSPNPRPQFGPAAVTMNPSNSTSDAPSKSAMPSSDPRQPDSKDPTSKRAFAAQKAAPIPVAGRQNLPQHDQWFPIPGKYADPNTSGIQIEVGAGQPSQRDLNVD